MSRKHFEALAAKINSRRDDIRTCEISTDIEKAVALANSERFARDLAEVCADANPRFDTHRFLTACGIN